MKTLTKLGEPSFLDCFVEDELGSSCAETLVTYLAVSRQVCGEGPDTGRSRKGILRGCCETFPSRMAVKLVSTGRKTFDVRLHCANSPFGQSHNYRSIWGSNQRRAEKGYCEPVTKLFLWTRNLKTITIDFQSSNLFGSFPVQN